MSPEQNAQKVQEMYAAFQRGDIPMILNELDPAVEWEQPGPDNIPTAGCYKGREGVASFFSRVAETWEFHAFEPKEYVAEGDRVVAMGSYVAKARTTGRTVEADWAMSFVFRNGKLLRFREYTDTAAMTAAV